MLRRCEQERLHSAVHGRPVRSVGASRAGVRVCGRTWRCLHERPVCWFVEAWSQKWFCERWRLLSVLCVSILLLSILYCMIVKSNVYVSLSHSHDIWSQLFHSDFWPSDSNVEDCVIEEYVFAPRDDETREELRQTYGLWQKALKRTLVWHQQIDWFDMQCRRTWFYTKNVTL